MPTTIGVERTKQALRRDRLLQAEEARHRAFFFDQESRINRASRIVHRHNQIEIVPERCNPAMLRGILEQQHSRQGAAHPFLAMRPPPLRFRYQPRRLQREPRHRVAELVIVPPHQLLVEMLHREVAIALTVKIVHPLKFTRRRPARRYFPDPAIAQTIDPVLLIANAQPPEITPRHPQLASSAVNRCRSYCSSASSKRDTNTSHSIAVRRIRCPPEQAANMADNSRATKGGQLMRYRHPACGHVDPRRFLT